MAATWGSAFSIWQVKIRSMKHISAGSALLCCLALGVLHFFPPYSSFLWFLNSTKPSLHGCFYKSTYTERSCSCPSCEPSRCVHHRPGYRSTSLYSQCCGAQPYKTWPCSSLSSNICMLDAHLLLGSHFSYTQSFETKRLVKTTVAIGHAIIHVRLHGLQYTYHNSVSI